jgi:uncharacterized protein YegL
MAPDQVPFSAADSEFAQNPEPRCACILLVDTSGSMGGEPIRELNNGLVQFKDELMADSLAAKRCEIAIIKFGGSAEQVVDFKSAQDLRPPTLIAEGDTPMGAALHVGLDLLEARKSTYKSNGITYFMPWVFLITDGGPTDEWKAAAERVKSGHSQKAFNFFAIGVGGANFDILRQISPSEPLKLKGLRFQDFFRWLSNSMRAASNSRPGEAIVLVNPVSPKGWGEVPL